MSRGLGRVQRRTLVYLRREPAGRENGVAVPVSTAQVAAVVFNHWGRRAGVYRKNDATAEERKAVQRALHGLEQRGLVERAPWRSGQASYWRVVR